MDPVTTLVPPDISLRSGRYLLRFARDRTDLERAFRLRYRVFNVELSEGLADSHIARMDRDAFDEQCHQMVVFEETTGNCVGTYRLQTCAMAEAGIGFYSATEFDLTGVPDSVITQSVEAGRACIDAGHRTLNVLHLLWKGLGAYVSDHGMRFLFGCCSLTSQDPSEGVAVERYLADHGYMPLPWSVQPRPENACRPENEANRSEIEVKIPRLMKAYLAQGAVICGPPALDRSFGTIDFLALFDIEKLSRSARSYYNIRA